MCIEFLLCLICCGYIIVLCGFVCSCIHILQGCFTGTGAILRLPQCQRNNPEGHVCNDLYNIRAKYEMYEKTDLTPIENQQDSVGLTTSLLGTQFVKYLQSDICVCMYVYMCIHTHVYIYIYIQISTKRYMCLYVCIYVYTYTHTHTHIYIYIYICCVMWFMHYCHSWVIMVAVDGLVPGHRQPSWWHMPFVAYQAVAYFTKEVNPSSGALYNNNNVSTTVKCPVRNPKFIILLHCKTKTLYFKLIASIYLFDIYLDKEFITSVYNNLCSSNLLFSSNG